LKKRFLITTALQDTWKKDVPVLFLGEWCKLYKDKDFWKGLDAEVVPYRWNDRSLVYKDYQYLNDLYERILPYLGDCLNNVHNVAYPTRYWRIIIGPWLNIFIQIVFERWMQLQEVRNYQIEKVYVTSVPDPSFVPRDMTGFAKLFITDAWNYYIYSFIIRNYLDISWTEKIYHSENNTCYNTQRQDGIRTRLKEIFYKTFEKLERKKDGLVNNLSLSFRSKMRLFFRYGYFERNINDDWMPLLEVKSAQREWELDIPVYTGFERCLKEIIPHQIPMAYVEGYNAIRGKIQQSNLPSTPRFIATSYVFYGETFKFWTAEKAIKGAKILISQHGGGYGIGKWFTNEQHEICISDIFLSWGWSDDKGRVLPAGILKRNPFNKRSLFNQQYCILILVSTPVYSYKLYSEIIASQWLPYFRDQCTFIDSLPLEFRENLLVKAYDPDFGWDHIARLRDCFPNINITSGRMLSEISDKCRIVISTYNSTSFLETLIKNIPTIVFWDPRYWELRESAIPFFQELKRVGIFHESPEEAAQQLTKVWDSVADWWLNSDVQAAVNKFVHQFCRQPKDPAGQLMKYIDTSFT
jgi:putative transferase (TIGR04331 family)